MFVVIDLNRYFALQCKADNTGSDIFFSPSIARAAISGRQLFQNRFVADDVKNKAFFISNIDGKPGTGNKLIELSDMVCRDIKEKGEDCFVSKLLD